MVGIMSRIPNQGPPRGLSARSLQTVANGHETEDAQLRAVATALHNAGVEGASQPTVEALSKDRKTMRVYVWKTPFGDVVLATGPSFLPEVQIVDGNASWNAAPAGTYVRGESAEKTPALLRRLEKAAAALQGALAKRARRPPAKTRAPKKTRPADPVEAITELIETDVAVEEIVADVKVLTRDDAVAVAAALDVPVTPDDTAPEIKEAIVEHIEEALPAEVAPKVRKPRTKKPPKDDAPSASEVANVGNEIANAFMQMLQARGLIKNPRRGNPDPPLGPPRNPIGPRVDIEDLTTWAKRSSNRIVMHNNGREPARDVYQMRSAARQIADALSSKLRGYHKYGDVDAGTDRIRREAEHALSQLSRDLLTLENLPEDLHPGDPFNAWR